MSYDIDFCRIFNSWHMWLVRKRLHFDQNLIKTGHIIDILDWRKGYGGSMGRIESRECGFDCLLGKRFKIILSLVSFGKKWRIWVLLSFVLYYMLISFGQKADLRSCSSCMWNSRDYARSCFYRQRIEINVWFIKIAFRWWLLCIYSQPTIFMVDIVLTNVYIFQDV